MMSYLGPFLKIKQPKITYEVCGKKCSDKKCEFSGVDYTPKAKFCVYCGSTLVEVIRSDKKSAIDVRQLLCQLPTTAQRLQCLLLSSLHTYEYWYPDAYPKRLTCVDSDYDQEEFEITNIDKDAELKWFTETYKKELAIIQKAAGDSAQILWGFLYSYNSD